MRTALKLNHATVLVVGLARSGRAAVDLLLASGSAVVATDLTSTDDLRALASGWSRRGARVVLGENPPGLIEGVDLVVLSPGVPHDTPLAVGARSRGIRVIGDREPSTAETTRYYWSG